MSERKLLLVSTLILFIASFIVIKIHQGPPPLSINTEHQLSYGRSDAPVHLILFEEFACHQCQHFHKEILPNIDKTYVDTGKVRVTIIPLAFLEDSIPACNLLLSVQKEFPSETKQFFDFLFDLPQEDLLSSSFRHLLGLYENLPIGKILQTLKQTNFEDEREHNIALAKQVYPDDILVPIVLINGKLVPNTQSVTKAIDAAL